eukprot:4778079-Pyramimonas_sp.AAC.1
MGCQCFLGLSKTSSGSRRDPGRRGRGGLFKSWVWQEPDGVETAPMPWPSSRAACQSSGGWPGPAAR